MTTRGEPKARETREKHERTTKEKDDGSPGDGATGAADGDDARQQDTRVAVVKRRIVAGSLCPMISKTGLP